ncbi:hypothetical protein V498_06741 [Pseudogymnoascus sp. VKM F-4517 (FW-2822)]|nr:hypothetical protein V498_06741 [Pseudogymnoascus sp. VKM F-4517 (FW-2822)]
MSSLRTFSTTRALRCHPWVDGSIKAGTMPMGGRENAATAGPAFNPTLPFFSLTGKTAVITGGARGLGLAMSKALVMSGSDLAIVDINSKLKSTLHSYINLSPKVTAHYADVSAKSEVDSAIAEILGQHSQITNLITCAGFCENADAIGFPPERIKRMLGVNVEGTYYFATGVAKHMIERQIPGTMVFIGSISGSIVNVPQPQALYNASKAAVRHLAASLAVEWANKDIRVNCLSPGYMLTEIAMDAQILVDNPGLKAEWESKIPQGKMGAPEELMGTVAFLSSDASRYITGQEIKVDGGYTLKMSVSKSCIVYPRKELASKRKEYFRDPFAEGSLPNGGFVLHDERFSQILGSNPTIKVIAEDSEPFAHEAGVYIPTTGDVYITSNHIRHGGKKHVRISRVFKDRTGYHVEQIEPGIALANGGVNYREGILFCEQGSLTGPGGLVYMKPQQPYETEMIIRDYHGRQFNSVNDVVIHNDGSIWFTDPAYGHEQGIRPLPQLPPQTYRYDPETGDIRAMDDSLTKPNGLCFSPDQLTLYITDTLGMAGDPHCPGIYSPAKAASIYAFDIITRHGAPFLANKRLFAFADIGIPDGIKCDTNGNVYSGCGDGVHVWSPGGTLIGKVYVPSGCANFCFGRGGEMFLLNEQKMWRAQLSPELKGDLLGL